MQGRQGARVLNEVRGRPRTPQRGLQRDSGGSVTVSPSPPCKVAIVALDDLIDFDRYPIHELAGAAAQGLVAEFVPPSAARARPPGRVHPLGRRGANG